MRSLREYYTRPHPYWPKSKAEALDEISDINDLLDRGGWNKQQRNWAYSRRRKLVRYINDENYRSYTSGVNKAMVTINDYKDESDAKVSE